MKDNGDSRLIIVEPNNKREEIISESVSFVLKIEDISHTITLCKGKTCILFLSDNYELKLKEKNWMILFNKKN